MSGSTASAIADRQLAPDELYPADLRRGDRILFKGRIRHVLRIRRVAKGWAADLGGDARGTVIFGPFAVIRRAS